MGRRQIKWILWQQAVTTVYTYAYICQRGQYLSSSGGTERVRNRGKYTKLAKPTRLPLLVSVPRSISPTIFTVRALLSKEIHDDLRPLWWRRGIGPCPTFCPWSNGTVMRIPCFRGATDAILPFLLCASRCTFCCTDAGGCARTWSIVGKYGGGVENGILVRESRLFQSRSPPNERLPPCYIPNWET